jgi:enoyl-CoA hydratase
MQKIAVPSIEFTIDNHIGILTVNRPEVRNALHLEAMTDFAAAIEQAETDPDLHVLIITGAGKTFISGGDLGELQGYNTEEDARRMIALMGDALNRLSNLPCITIAAMEGTARGGGVEIALACDWRVIADDADLGFVQIRLGLTTGWGGAARLMQLIGYARALDLLTSGHVISASEAYYHGIVTHLARSGETVHTAIRMGEALMQHDPAAVRAYKRILKATQRSTAEAQNFEREEFPKLWAAEAHVHAVENFLRRKS